MNKRINQTIAYSTAEVLVKGKFDPRIKELKKAGGALVRAYLLSLIPEEIKRAYSQYPTYFHTTGSLAIEGTWHRFGEDCYFSFDRIPDPCDYRKQSAEYAVLSEQIWTILDRIAKLRDERAKVKNQLVETALSLKNFKTLEKEFPEFYNAIDSSYKEEKVVTTVTHPLQELRDLLNS